MEDFLRPVAAISRRSWPSSSVAVVSICQGRGTNRGPLQQGFLNYRGCSSESLFRDRALHVRNIIVHKTASRAR